MAQNFDGRQNLINGACDEFTVGSTLKEKVSGKNIDESITNRQIYQTFPPLKFYTIQYP